jgi:ribosomal protein L11 methylase PrmA
MSSALAPRGIAVLSGLLRDQEKFVLSFYRAQGLVFPAGFARRTWSALVLSRPGG